MPGPMPAGCTFPDEFLQDALDVDFHATPFDDVLPRFRSFSAIAWCCSFMSSPACGTRRPARSLAFRPGRCNVGEAAGLTAIFPSTICLGVGANPLFPPLDQALIHAMACEVIAETEEPLSRQSLADLVRRSQTTLDKKISRSTVWRMLHEGAIKPWQYEHWLFPKDPRFAEKAGRFARQAQPNPVWPRSLWWARPGKARCRSRRVRRDWPSQRPG